MNPGQDKLFELLATRATEGLSEAESRHLERLLGDSPRVDPLGFERAAAAVHLALLGPERPVPDALRRKLVSAGLRRQVAPPDGRDGAPA